MAAFMIVELRVPSEAALGLMKIGAVIQVNVLHAENDAVFLHSQNPNADNFPYTMQNLDWEVPRVRSLLAEQIPIPNLRVGFNRKTRWLCLYSPESGVPLQS